MDATTDYEASDTFYMAEEGGIVKEKRSTVSGVIQYFHFTGKRGRGSAYFGRGKEHARWLLVPVHRGNQRMQRCGGVRWLSTVGVRRHLD
jgi:hypothetical protein